MDIAQIRELIRTVETSDVSEVQIEEGELKITVRKGGVPVHVEEGAETAAPMTEVASEAGAEAESYPDHWKAVKAPMVGTFYRSPAPGAEPFVEEGSEFIPGQTLCILEAMKLMNEITAEDKGVVKKIMIEDGNPVEFSGVLFLYEPVV